MTQYVSPKKNSWFPFLLIVCQPPTVKSWPKSHLTSVLRGPWQKNDFFTVQRGFACRRSQPTVSTNKALVPAFTAANFAIGSKMPLLWVSVSSLGWVLENGAAGSIVSGEVYHGLSKLHTTMFLDSLDATGGNMRNLCRNHCHGVKLDRSVDVTPASARKKQICHLLWWAGKWYRNTTMIYGGVRRVGVSFE